MSPEREVRVPVASEEPEDVAHQIRTPLASIQNAAHVLSHRARDLAAGRAPPEQALPVMAECLTVIEESVERIDRYSRSLHQRLRQQR